jgi:uncharacterized protein YoxC
MQKKELVMVFYNNVVEDAQKRLVEKLERDADLLETTAANLRKKAKRLAQDDEGVATKEEQALWAMNELENMVRNLNMQDTARHVLELTQAKMTLEFKKEQA